MGVHVGDVGRVVTVGQDPAVDGRVQRDHPVPEHVGEARDLLGGDDRKAGIGEHLGGPARADELPTQLDQRPAEVDHAGLVVGRQQGSANRGGVVVGAWVGDGTPG
ncbi:MAG: hypothetical protein BWX86_02471 [Verrucomicrobia bacterium ADurb.Bin122]|nr:MAG: hypothetical protein BWX86_02471 [Verrucomicrobia bacterium ADurb.Bin122]